MKRAPFQVLVIPFIRSDDGTIKYCVLKRESSTGGYWQFVAGGGAVGETKFETARRESSEEIGSDPNSELIELDSMTMIPVVNVCGFKWGKDTIVIPEYCFGIELSTEELSLSHEHTAYQWLSFDEAHKLVHWESNRIALWELNHRLRNNMVRASR